MGATGYILNKSEEYSPKFRANIELILNDFSSCYKFHQSLSEYTPTPLHVLPALAKQSGLKGIYVKDEGQRFGTNALKILGATYAVNQFTKENNIIGICTATDGNHGRTVAWASKRQGVKSVVFVPQYTAVNRIKAIEKEGGKVIVSKGDYDQAVREANYFAKEKHFKLIQDTAWKEYQDVPATITSGYYTQMLEIIEQSKNLTIPFFDAVFIQAGVGSWPSAIVHFFRKKLQNTKTKIICVEPFESDCIYESIKQQSISKTPKSQKTIMAGLNCGTPSTIAFEILKAGIDAFLLISDQYTIDAIKHLNAPMPNDPYIASGESGAAGLGGLLATLNNPALIELKKYLKLDHNSNILVFNTENVTDSDLTNRILRS